METTFLDKVDKTQNPATIISWIICFCQIYISDGSPPIIACILRLVFWILTFALCVKVQADWNSLHQTKIPTSLESKAKPVEVLE